MHLTPLSVLFLFLFFIVAFLYSSVGHGGASGYLSLMAFLNFTPEVSKISALVINMIVSGIAFYQYYRSNHFRKKLFIPFAIASIPLAYLGSQFIINVHIYKVILGIVVLLAGVGLLVSVKKKNEEKKHAKLYIALLIGGTIGFVSGIIGIGGGIFLSPLILLLGWGDAKETAAVSALFILVNSISAFTGMVSKVGMHILFIVPFLCMALVGGFIGSYFGSQKLNNLVIKRLLGVVLLIAGFKLVTSI